MDDNNSLPESEYEAIWSGCGLVELTGWSSVSMTGDDRQVFLQSFCTNDVKRLAPGASCEAFFTNVKGKIIGHGLITCREEELVIVTLPEQAPPLIEHLDRYVIREDVQLRETTAERAYLLVAGDRDCCANVLVGHTGYATNWFQSAGWFTLLLDVAPSEIVWRRDSFGADGGVVCGPKSFEARRIEAGLPLFGVDFDDNNLPQEIGRDAEAISFTKGCYLGQETVARIDALGHVNQRIVGVRFTGEIMPSIGAELTRAGAKAGRVSSVAYSPRLGASLALAMVRKESNSPGTTLESACGECEVVLLPIGA